MQFWSKKILVMNRIKQIFFVLLLSCLAVQSVKADDFTTDDSCVTGVGIYSRFLNSYTAFGLYESFSYNFHMYGAPGTTTNSVVDGYGTGDDSTDGCNADYYIDSGGTSAYIHNSTYCQSNGTNCCPDAIDSTTGMPYPSAIGVAGGCTGDCNPAGGVKFCFDQINSAGSSECVDVWAQSGYSETFFYPPAQIRSYSTGGEICIQFATNLGYQNIGCKTLPDCTQDVVSQSCTVAASCYSYQAQKSMALLPITGAIMQCVNDTLYYLFYGNPGCSGNSDGGMDYVVRMFPTFQSEMRDSVRSALMLYIILTGIKMVLSSEHPSKSEFFMIAAKFILVLYFSTGININGAMGTDGQPYYDDGITNYMLPLFTSGASEIVDMVYSAGGAVGLCAYDSSLYPDGYGYLSVWDSLDCRLLYYFGIDLAGLSFDSIASGSVITPDDLGTPILLDLIVPGFFSFQLLLLVFIVVFMMLLVSILIYFLNISVISAILVSVLIYMAPIFVPMVLFEPTKQYYDSWLKLTISFALQPMIVAAYIAMMFTVFDQTMFGTCLFQNYSVNFQMDGVTKTGLPIFNLCAPDVPGSVCYGITSSTCTTDSPSDSGCYSTSALDMQNVTDCSKTIGYYINPTNAQSYINSISAIFFTIYQLDSNVATDMTNALITLCLFGYLFYKFADVLSDFAAELTGGDPLGASAGSPMAVVKKAAQMAATAAKAAATKGSGSDGSGATSSSTGSKPRSGASSSSSK